MLSYRKLAMRVLGPPPPSTGGVVDLPRPALSAGSGVYPDRRNAHHPCHPGLAGTWHIEDGDITVKAGETKGTNKVSQGANQEVEDTDTIITNRNEGTASSNTVTIDANGKNDKVEVTLKDVNIDTSSRNKAAVSVTGEGDTNIKLNGDNALKSDIYRSGIYGSGSLTISGGENDSLTAQGGAGGSGIHISRNGSLTISGGTVTANGDDGGKRHLQQQQQQRHHLRRYGQRQGRKRQHLRRRRHLQRQRRRRLPRRRRHLQQRHRSVGQP